MVSYDIYLPQEYCGKLEDLATEIYPGEDFETLTEEQISVLADRVIADLGNWLFTYEKN